LRFASASGEHFVGRDMAVAAVVFDAYGTLFDVHSIAATAERFFPGQGASLSLLWRERQIDYTRLRTLSQRYLPFSRVTSDALSYTLQRMKLSDPEGAAATALLSAYRKLAVFPENVATLEQIKTSGLPMAILSNGDEEMLHAVVDHAKLRGYFDHILSCDQVGRFKTAPEAYQLACDAFACSASDVLFVSSNCWDACGAGWFGFKTFWVNRRSEPVEELGVQLDASSQTMTPLPAFAAKLNAL
jgi:2-haloacid dehalogenase